MTAEMQHLVLFWVFVGFFLLIGVIALLAIMGVIKTEQQFRNWAVGGFAASVIGVVIIWAKSQPPLDIFVNLEPPQNVAADAFELISGTYEYYEQSNTGQSNSHPGPVELTAGQLPGWWTAKFPYTGVSEAVKLTLMDKNGHHWAVRPFYPNYNRQPLTETGATQSRIATERHILIAIGNAVAAEGEIKFNNYAKATATYQGRTYYDWRVFVDEPAAVLARIASVQYLLHPSFPEPLQIRTNPEEKFAVEAHGWGVFNIQITIKYRDGTMQSEGYYLDFNKGWP
jgi:hypothetical protein